MPPGLPSRVVIGRFEATNLTRNGNVLLCEIAIVKDANRAALHDCHLEFEGVAGTGIVAIKKYNVFRVGGE